MSGTFYYYVLSQLSYRRSNSLSQIKRDSMVRRVVKNGANAGREFFGCSGYPRCNGISAIQE